MPFEGDIADYATITFPVIETPQQSVIRRAREMLADPRAWSSRTFREGDSFCILGALREAHHGNALRPGTGGAQDYVMRIVRRRGYSGITTFNDSYASHADVLTALDLAYELAGKPKGAKFDASRLRRKPMPCADYMLGTGTYAGRFGRDALTGGPLPPPLRLGDLRPSVAEMVERIRVANAAAQKHAAPMSLRPAPLGGLQSLARAVEPALLAAAGFVLRGAV
jgi:hypothetical protein